jgi:hypothetical protein
MEDLAAIPWPLIRQGWSSWMAYAKTHTAGKPLMQRSHAHSTDSLRRSPRLTYWKAEPGNAKATLLTRMRSWRIALGNTQKVADMNDSEIEQELLAMPVTELAKGFA